MSKIVWDALLAKELHTLGSDLLQKKARLNNAIISILFDPGKDDVWQTQIMVSAWN